MGRTEYFLTPDEEAKLDAETRGYFGSGCFVGPVDKKIHEYVDLRELFLVECCVSGSQLMSFKALKYL